MSAGILFCLCAAWSFATPIGAGQDEPAQLVKAASVARGEFVGSTPSGKSLALAARNGLAYCRYVKFAHVCNRAVTVVTVPQTFANLRIPSCYRKRPKVPAGCAQGFSGSGQETIATTYVGRYPPLYYAIVGLPSLAWHSDVAVYLMRLLSGVLSALFVGLALALATVWSRSRLLTLAVAVTATPMVIILGSVVNPSGLEVATAICVWTGGLILVLERASQPPTSLVTATAAAAAVMVLTRGLSPLWLAVIAVFLAALAPRSLPTLIRCRSVRVAGVVVIVAGVVAVVYVLDAHALAVLPVGQAISAGTPLSRIIELALERTDTLVAQFVGTIGWAETNPPTTVLALWILSATAVVVLALVASRRRQTVVLVALVATSLVLPTALVVSQAHVEGLVWQARDGFPLYAGILLVAGAVAGRRWLLDGDVPAVAPPGRSMTRRLGLLVAVAVAVTQFGDFVWALRRYTVGLGAVINPFAHVRDGWSPPVAPLVLVVVAAIVAVAYGWWIARLGRPHTPARSDVT